MAEYRGRPTSTLIEMMTAGLFDELTDEECDRLGVDIQLDWQQYCRLVEPGCSLHYFMYGEEEE